jgi:MFS family permease
VLCALAPTPTTLIAARALQGAVAALMVPQGFGLIRELFGDEGQQKAFGVFGPVMGLAAVAGPLVGGALVNLDIVGTSWRAIFLVNVPIVIALLVIGPLVLSESRAGREPGHNRPDVLGALLGTGGLLALVLAVVRAEPLGFGSPEVLALAATSVLLLSAFVAVEHRSDSPLIPLSLFRNRSLTVNSALLAVNAGAFLAMFFLTAVYLQTRLHFSALHAGLAFLPMGIAAILAAILVAQLVTRLGTRPVQLGGAALAAAGLVLLARSRPEGAYAAQLLPGLVLFGAGVISVGVPTQVAAVSQVRRDEAGVASGVVNTAWQVGGSLGLAIASTLSASRGCDPPQSRSQPQPPSAPTLVSARAPVRRLVNTARHATDAKYAQAVRPGRQHAGGPGVDPHQVVGVEGQRGVADVNRTSAAQRHVQLLLPRVGLVV